MSFGENTEFDRAVARNMMLKSRILSAILGGILIVQIVAIIIFLSTQKVFGTVTNAYIFIGPTIIFIAFIAEVLFNRHTKKLLASDKNPAAALKYSWMVAIAEILLPGIIILFASQLVNQDFFKEVNLNLLNSPPFIIFFILIILNALSLNFRLCVVSGILAGLQYLFLSLYLNSEGDSTIATGNIIIKSVLICVCGITTGLVSKRIREAVMISLEAKEKLINRLDAMVRDKTAEITLQKEEIEEKNKEIVASITYASRIQRALMTSENNVDRMLRSIRSRTKNR